MELKIIDPCNVETDQEVSTEKIIGIPHVILLRQDAFVVAYEQLEGVTRSPELKSEAKARMI